MTQVETECSKHPWKVAAVSGTALIMLAIVMYKRMGPKLFLIICALLIAIVSIVALLEVCGVIDSSSVSSFAIADISVRTSTVLQPAAGHGLFTADTCLALHARSLALACSVKLSERVRIW